MYVLVVISAFVCVVVVSVDFVPVLCVELYCIVSFVVAFPVVYRGDLCCWVFFFV